MYEISAAETIALQKRVVIKALRSQAERYQATAICCFLDGSRKDGEDPSF